MVSGPVAHSLAVGNVTALLGSGPRLSAWEVARATYRAVFQSEPSGEAPFGAGSRCGWLGETEASLRSWEQAFAEFRRQSERAQAVLPAFYLCLGSRMSLGTTPPRTGGFGPRGRIRGCAHGRLGAPRSRLHGQRLRRSVDCGGAGAPGHRLGPTQRRRRPPPVRGTRARRGVDGDGPGRGGRLAARPSDGREALAGEGGDLDTVVLVSCPTPPWRRQDTQSPPPDRTRVSKVTIAAGAGVHRRTRPGRPGRTGVESLTERERQVARLVVDRRTNTEIAEALFVSPKTIETHLRNIFHKLDVSSRVELARVIERSPPPPHTS